MSRCSSSKLPDLHGEVCGYNTCTEAVFADTAGIMETGQTVSEFGFRQDTCSAFWVPPTLSSYLDFGGTSGSAYSGRTACTRLGGLFVPADAKTAFLLVGLEAYPEVPYLHLACL